MRVNLVQNYPAANSARRGYYSNALNSNNSQQKITSPVAPRIVHLSFTGKNMWQAASITPENLGLGLAEAYQGGEGNVGLELPASLRKHEKVKVTLPDGKVEERKVDARSFMPFWEHNNSKGGYKFLIHKGMKASELADEMPASSFYSANLGEDIEAVAKKMNVSMDEISYVIQSKPNGNGFNAKSKYCLLDPTSVSGEITRLSETTLGETEKVPYRLFAISANNPSYNQLKGEPHYFIYTPHLARASKPYAYDCFGNTPFEAEIVNSDGMRALANVIHKQMNTEEFGYYDPANVLCHDRIAHTYGNHIANMSAAGDTNVDGVKAHIIAHNTGRNYQGATDDIFKYQVVVADVSDAEAMKNLPNFDILQKAKQYGIDSEVLSPRERQIAHAIMDPHLANFKDGAGSYNILKAGISAARINPYNTSTGTVSYTFGEEMRSSDMYDAAKYLTEDYAAIQQKDVLNGCTPASLELNNRDALLGRDKNNGLYAAREGFTPFEYNGNNIDEIVAAREKNSKWLTNLVWDAGEKGQDELNKLFFNEAQISDGHNVKGYLSPIKEGDILVMGWGRPDEQKGFPITMKGFLKFLQREDIPKETKLKVKVIIGGGPWPKKAADYIDIMKDLDTIQTMDGGIYKHNAMIVDGWFSKRLVGCTTYGMFTSRREMCGITPLEAKAAGVPYGATKTGGPVDYTNPSNGFLTKEAVERNPEHYGLTWKSSDKEIDAARVNRQSDQVADIYKAMIDEYTNERSSFVAKCKKNIEELIDWHNNSEYNRGKSANRRYLDDIFEVEKGWDARNKNPLQRIVGKFGEFKEDVETLMGKTKSKSLKVVLAVVVGALAVGSGIYLYLKKPKQKSLDEAKTADAKTPDTKPEEVKKEIKAVA